MADKVHCIRKTLRLMPEEAKMLAKKACDNRMNEAEYIRLLISQKPNDYMVLNVLISNPDARDDDMRLYYYVCRDCISETHDEADLSFEEVMTNYKELGCPGFESVRRTRQKIQAILPELGCSPAARRRRNKGVVAYTNYALDREGN